jgi:hypothetical protein
MDEQQFAKASESQQNASEQSADEPKKGKKRANARTKAAQSDYTPEYESPGRSSSADRANAFNSLAWMVEGATGLVEELRHSDLGLSEAFWVHLYAMRREGLLAARAVVDSLLAQSEKESQEAQEQIKREARRGEVAIE